MTTTIDATVRQLNEELSKMNGDMARLRDEMMSMWKVIKDKKVHDLENTWSLYLSMKKY
jgi:hypothetical protein